MSFRVLSGCNILKAVLEVIGALLHREKIKLAAPEKDLRSHIWLLGQDTLTRTELIFDSSLCRPSFIFLIPAILDYTIKHLGFV